MILLVCTTDGYDREDGNVFYANYLLIDAPTSATSAIKTYLNNKFQAKVEDNYITFKSDVHNTSNELFEEPQDLAKELTSVGWKTQVVNKLFLIQDQS